MAKDSKLQIEAEDDEEDLFGQDDDAEEAVGDKDTTTEDLKENMDQHQSFSTEHVSASNGEDAATLNSSRKKNLSDTPKEDALKKELEVKPLSLVVDSPVPRKGVVGGSAQDSFFVVPRKPYAHETDAIKSQEEVSKASRFNLHESVVIPDSVDESLLEGRILDSLRQLPPNLCNDALQEYHDAIKQQKNIRSHGAYLFGVLKRYLSVHERAGDEGSMGHQLTPVVQSRLDQLVRDGFCTEDEMNEKVKGKIRMLSEKDALFAIEEFGGVDRGSIRNVGSYFMGILNRYMRGERSKDRQTQDYQGRRDRGRNLDREFRNHRENDSQYGNDRKGTTFQRDRSRDARDKTYKYHNVRSDFDRHPSHYGHQPQQTLPSTLSFRSPYNQQQMPQPPPQHSYTSNQGYQNQNTSTGSSYLQQQPMQSNLPQYQQQPGMVGIPSQPFQGQTQLSSMINAATAPNLHSGFAPQSVFQPPPHNYSRNTNSWQQPQPPPGAPPPDIHGIAAKAAQALAASQSILQQNTSGYHPISQSRSVHQSMGNVPQQFPNTPQSQQYHVQSQSQQFSSGPPQSQSQQFSSGPPQSQSQQFSSGPPQSQPYSPVGFQSQNSTSQNPQRRGRTTATMHELSVPVQYAVQSLLTAGNINGPLDEGILGMIKDLPEPMALESLNRFASMDKSSMRNTIAYLAGVLRRELEKINRR